MSLSDKSHGQKISSAPSQTAILSARHEHTSIARAVWQTALLFALPIILLLLIPTRLLPIAFAAAPIYFAMRWFALGSPFPKTRINIFLLVFLLMFALAFMLSPKYPEGIVLAAHLVAGVLILFVVFDHVQTLEGAWLTTALLVLIGAGLALITPFTVPWRGAPMFPLPFVYEQNWPLLFETANVNVMAGALAPILVLALTLLNAPNPRVRLIGALALAPLAIILFLLQSRGAWLGVAVGVLIWAALYNRWFVPALPILLLSALVLNNAFGGVSPTQFFYGPVGAELNESAAERQVLWEQGLNLLAQSPLQGIGVGSYSYVARVAPPFSLLAPGKSLPNAHNLFIQIALDTGILGIASFLGMWVALLLVTWRAYRTRATRDLAIGVLAALAVILAHGLGESAYWGFKTSFVMWFICALALLFDKSITKL